VKVSEQVNGITSSRLSKKWEDFKQITELIHQCSCTHVESWQWGGEQLLRLTDVTVWLWP